MNIVVQPRLLSVLFFVMILLATACATIRSHRQLEQPVGSQLTSGIGGTLFRLNKLGDLPNAFGGRDIWGGKVDKGFAEVRLVGVEDRTILLEIVDVNRQSSETTMDRYKPFGRTAVVSLDVQQSTNIGTDGAPKPNRVRLDTLKQQDIVISGIRIRFLDIQPYSLQYILEDLQPQ
jgi:hypothetical protein